MKTGSIKLIRIVLFVLAILEIILNISSICLFKNNYLEISIILDIIKIFIIIMMIFLVLSLIGISPSRKKQKNEESSTEKESI